MAKKLMIFLLVGLLLTGCANPGSTGGDPTTTAPGTQTGPSDPTTTQPGSSDPSQPETTNPSQPEETDPSQPEVTDPKPTEPKPTDPKPTEPKPTEPKPTEPKPTEPKPTEPDFTVPEVTDPIVTDPEVTYPPTAGITVQFQRMNQNDEEYAVITGLRADGSQAWTYTTGRHPANLISMVVEVGVWSDRFYYVENGKIVALDLENGNVLWTNAEFGGVPAEDAAFIDADGTVYLSGYSKPDLFVVSAQGKTLRSIKTIDPAYFWPTSITDAGGGFLCITMKGTGSMSSKTVRFYFSKDTGLKYGKDDIMVKALLKQLYPGKTIASCSINHVFLPDATYRVDCDIAFQDGTTAQTVLVAYPKTSVFFLV